jgi:hypothetical protein
LDRKSAATGERVERHDQVHAQRLKVKAGTQWVEVGITLETVPRFRHHRDGGMRDPEDSSQSVVNRTEQRTRRRKSYAARPSSSGDFIADVLNRQTRTRQYDYMHFYLGTMWVSDRADLTPVYRMIFRRLRRRELDWIYHFPRSYAVDFRPLKEALDRKNEPDWMGYSPSEALAKEAERQEHDRKLAEFRESLD